MSPTKLDALTPEQAAALAAYHDAWLAVGRSTAPADRPAAEAAITRIYARMGRGAPRFWWCDSPRQAVIAQMIVLGDSLRDNLWDNLWDSLGDSLWDNLGGNLRVNLGDNLGANIWDNLGGNLWDNLRDNLWDNLGDNLWDSLWDNLGGNLRVNLGDNLWDSLWNNLWVNLGDKLRADMETPLWGAHDAYWIAYFLFPHEHLRPMHTPEQMAGLSDWAGIAQSALWWWPYEHTCFVSDRPEWLSLDDQGRLHDETGPAMRFRDGYGFHAMNGVRVPAHVVEQPERISVEEIRAERNAEVRRVMLARYGEGRFLEDSGARLVHRDRYGELYRQDLADDEPLAMVRVLNSTPEPDGSIKPYWLRVPPDVPTAQAAVAWTFGVDVAQYQPEIET